MYSSTGHRGGQIKKAYLDTESGQLHYRVSRGFQDATSPPDPLPVLLLHMSASSSKSFSKLMGQLSAIGYSCFAPDMPGFGESFNPEADPSSIKWYAEVFHRAFLALDDFKRGCRIIGHHSGGVIGIELAARFDGFVHSLTLVGPAIMSAEDRLNLSKTFLEPFNKPAPDGNHLLKTWDYLLWEGISRENIDLLHRETLDHMRAWKGRSQIYACVWKYDCAKEMLNIGPNCEILALCAEDDVLWPYFENVGHVQREIATGVIQGGNFSPDLDPEGITKAFMQLIS